MQNYKIITGIICVLASVAAFTGSYSVNAVAENFSTNGTTTTCSDELLETMGDMHHEMEMVKPSGDIDEDFVRLMLPHHKAAIEMAKVELKCGKDEVNRRLAQEIIADQQSEIDLMNLWLLKHKSQEKPSPNEMRNEEKKP
jgi:uncharacterized protein (DUF305 family)